MPHMRDPRTVADRWVSQLSGAVAKIREGVQAVTTSPTAQAAAAADKWQARLAQPDVKAKFQRNLQRVSLTEWQNDMINKGLPRIPQGAQAAHDKFQAFLTQFLPYVNQVAQTVRQMPHLTLEDGIARAAAQIRGNAAFRRTGP